MFWPHAVWNFCLLCLPLPCSPPCPLSFTLFSCWLLCPHDPRRCFVFPSVLSGYLCGLSPMPFLVSSSALFCTHQRPCYPCPIPSMVALFCSLIHDFTFFCRVSLALHLPSISQDLCLYFRAGLISDICRILIVSLENSSIGGLNWIVPFVSCKTSKGQSSCFDRVSSHTLEFLMSTDLYFCIFVQQKHPKNCI